MADIEDVGFIGGFPPTPREQIPIGSDEDEGAAPAAEAPKPEPKPEPSRLAEALKRDREERAARAQESKRQTDLEHMVAQLREENERLKKAPAFEDDPIGYIKARKLSPESQLLYGQSLLYDLAPEKAPPDLRIKMFEAREARRIAAAEEARKESEAKGAIEAQQRALQEFASTLERAAQSFTPGSYPESEDWFGEDRGTYAQSLMATATNIAKTAQAQKKVADLSPSAVAAVLEQEVSRRLAARDQRKAGRAPTKAVTPTGQRDEQLAETTTSTKGLNSGGVPSPKAMTDEERIQNAIKKGFRIPR